MRVQNVRLGDSDTIVAVKSFLVDRNDTIADCCIRGASNIRRLRVVLHLKLNESSSVSNPINSKKLAKKWTLPLFMAFASIQLFQFLHFCTCAFTNFIAPTAHRWICWIYSLKIMTIEILVLKNVSWVTALQESIGGCIQSAYMEWDISSMTLLLVFDCWKD